MRNGNCTLKELIDQIYVIEKDFTVADYRDGLQTHFTNASDNRNLTLKAFLKYAKAKKMMY